MHMNIQEFVKLLERNKNLFALARVKKHLINVQDAISNNSYCWQEQYRNYEAYQKMPFADDGAYMKNIIAHK